MPDYWIVRGHTGPILIRKLNETMKHVYFIIGPDGPEVYSSAFKAAVRLKELGKQAWSIISWRNNIYDSDHYQKEETNSLARAEWGIKTMLEVSNGDYGVQCVDVI